MSSAKVWSVIFSPHDRAKPSTPNRRSSSIWPRMSVARMKRYGERGHPCLTNLARGKGLPSTLLSLMANAADSYRELTHRVATPLWAKCEGEAHTPKSGNLESSGTPKISELKLKGQNTSHWGVLGVIGKVLKCRCLNWPLIGHLDI